MLCTERFETLLTSLQNSCPQSSVIMSNLVALYRKLHTPCRSELITCVDYKGTQFKYTCILYIGRGSCFTCPLLYPTFDHITTNIAICYWCIVNRAMTCQILQAWRGYMVTECKSQKRKQHCCSLALWHMCTQLIHPVWAHGHTNQQANIFASLFVQGQEANKSNTESTVWQ